MSHDPANRGVLPPGGAPEDLNAIDRAMLLALGHHQRDNKPLSLDQERLLDGWLAGRLSSNDADRAAELTKHNKLAVQRILERRLVTAANQGPDVPGVLAAGVLSVSQPARRSAGIRSSLRWPKFGGWQWAGLGAAAAVIAVMAIIVWQTPPRSNQRFQIAMVTIEDRSVLSEGPRYRTRGKKQQAPATDTPIVETPVERGFRDVEVPTDLLRRAIRSASTDKTSVEHSALLASLRTQYQELNTRSRILIDSVLADSIPENAPERAITQIRAYDLDDPRAAAIRSKIRTLPKDAPTILLTVRR